MMAFRADSPFCIADSAAATGGDISTTSLTNMNTPHHNPDQRPSHRATKIPDQGQHASTPSTKYVTVSFSRITEALLMFQQLLITTVSTRIAFKFSATVYSSLTTTTMLQMTSHTKYGITNDRQKSSSTHYTAKAATHTGRTTRQIMQPPLKLPPNMAADSLP